jgi:Zn-dependent protease
MFKKKEIVAIAISVIIMTLIISFSTNEKEILSNKLIIALVISLIVILISVLAKKITAHNINVKVTHKVWEWQRYGFGKGSYLKKPVPVGALLPLLLMFLSLGVIKFFTFLEFETQATQAKAVKKYGRFRFSNINEWDDALIGFYGLIALLILAVITSLLTSPIFPFKDLSKYAFIYAVCNLIPISSLDGTRIFFGSKPLYVTSLVLTLISGAILILNVL